MPEDAGTELSSIVNALGDPAVIATVELRVVAVNAAAMALAPGLRAGAGLAMGIRAPDMLEAARRVAASGEAENLIWNESQPGARLFDVRVGRIATGGKACLLLVMRDMSESRRIDRMRADFIANASHELRTPLASMLGFIETLQGPAKDDPLAREQFLLVMADQGRRMARLINDLLSLSHIERNLHIRPQARVDLVAIVHQVVDALRPVIEENAATIVLDLAPEAPVTGDADELVRVVENLVENAIKYGASPAGGPARIEVTLRAEGAAWALSVKDHGPGIAAEHLPRLTERFYRVDAIASRGKGGTGLGLAIVKHIVARHRGKFTIDSRLGEGSTFTIVLDRAA